MVLVENNQVPVRSVNPFVFTFNAAVLIHAEVVLERAEAHDGEFMVGGFIGQLRRAAYKLPALKIDVGE